MKTKSLVGLMLILLCGCEPEKPRIAKTPDVSIIRKKQEADMKRAETELAAAREELELLRIENRRLESEVNEAKRDLVTEESRTARARELGKAEGILESVTTPSRVVPRQVIAPRISSAGRVEVVPPPYDLPPLYKAKVIIKEQAEKKWKRDYSMVEYEINKQTKAYTELQFYAKHRWKNSLRTVMDEAGKKWHPDFSMVVYELEKQLDAKDRIEGK